MTGFILILIVIIILSIILYARDSGPTPKTREVVSPKVLPPRTGTDGSEILPNITDFFNREEELLALESLIKEKNWITIYGHPGTGKTYLVAQFVKRLPRGQGIFWYTCDERTRLEDLLSRLNRLLKERNDPYFEPILTDYKMGIKEKAALLLRRLDGKNILVIIDQAERIKDERLKGVLRYLGENTKFTKFILITSEEIGEIHPEEGVLFEIGGFKAQGLEKLIRSFGIDLKDTGIIEGIVERLGTSPLGLRLLGGLLNCYHRSIEAIMAKIRNGWVDLLNESLMMLREEEIDLLRQLAVANEPLPEDGIKYLYRRLDLKDTLSLLVSAGLVTREGIYYGLHPQIKDLIYPQIANRHKAHQALADYYLGLSQQRSLIGLALEASHHSIMAGNYDLAISILLRESTQMIKGGYASVLLEHLKMYERQKVSSKNWLYVAGLKGDTYKAMGYLEEARESYEDMLKTAEILNSHQGMATAYNNLGSIYKIQGDWNKAIDYYKRGLDVLKGIETIRRRPTPQDVVWVYRGKGKWNEAIRYYLKYYERDLKDSQQRGDLVGQANSYANLGSAYEAQGDWNRAIDYYNRCLEILRQIDDPIAEAKCYDNLGSVYSAKGDLNRAITYYEKGLEIFERIGEVAEDSRSLSNLAEIYWQMEDYAKAVSYYERSLDKLRGMADVLGEARCLVRFANLLKEKGDLNYATECLIRSQRIYEQLEGKIADPNFYETAAAIYEKEGDSIQALNYLKTGLEISIDENDVKNELHFSNLLGALLMKQERFDEAANYLNRALEIAEILGDLKSHLRVYINLSSLYKRKGKDKEAILYLERARALLNGVEGEGDLTEIYGELNNLYAKFGREEVDPSRTNECRVVKKPA